MESSAHFKEPPETNLDYYSKPENYSGSSLVTFTRFIIARNKENAQSNTALSFTKPVIDDSIPTAGDDVTLSKETLKSESSRQISFISSQDITDFLPYSAETPTMRSSDYLSKQENRSKNQTDEKCNRKIQSPFLVMSASRWKINSKKDFKTWKLRAKSALLLSGHHENLSQAKCATRKKMSYCLEVEERFKKISQAVKIVLKLAKSIMKTSDTSSALLKTFTSLCKVPNQENEETSSSENMKKYGLHFDPSYFKANREISLSTEVRAILKLHPNRRSEDQIQTAVFGLQSIPSFAEYPLHMQEKLAKVAWLDIVTPNRTIIKQGHLAENFYIIVSGQALVTIHRPGDASAQTAALMRKGTSFGELALLHHSRRTATVTSHDTVQLLSVGRDDFFDIFMSRDINGEIPEHIKILRQIEFMKDWPIEKLLERPDQCLLHFFKRNMVIVKDSKSSEWLYVVKSGSCQVLKQLKGVTARLGPVKGFESRPKNRNSRSSWKSLFNEGNRAESEKSQNMEHNLSNTEPAQEHLRKSSDISQTSNKFKSAEILDAKKINDNPVFVRIALLKPTDVFGLDQVSFISSIDMESASVSLVSLGAECIMLSKSFFVKHADVKVKKRLSEIVAPYPNEATLQESLQHKVDWELYKQSVLTVASPKFKQFKKKPSIVYW